MDKLLINREDFSDYKDISENMDVDRVNTYIQDAQILDMRDFLGRELYLLMLTDYNDEDNLFSDQIYTSLFFGATSNGVKYYGLKPMLIQYAYARMIEGVNANVTRAGVRQFNADESEPVLQGAIASLANTARATALAYREDMEVYLRDNISSYPKWKDTSTKDTGVNFFKIP